MENKPDDDCEKKVEETITTKGNPNEFHEEDNEIKCTGPSNINDKKLLNEAIKEENCKSDQALVTSKAAETSSDRMILLSDGYAERFDILNTYKE